jgi:hypothetical protein
MGTRPKAFSSRGRSSYRFGFERFVGISQRLDLLFQFAESFGLGAMAALPELYGACDRQNSDERASAQIPPETRDPTEWNFKASRRQAILEDEDLNALSKAFGCGWVHVGVLTASKGIGVKIQCQLLGL